MFKELKQKIVSLKEEGKNTSDLINALTPEEIAFCFMMTVM